MPKRVFDTKLLIEWELDLLEECPHVVYMGSQEVETFEYWQEVVLRAPDDGRLWSLRIEMNNGAGWNSLIGTRSRLWGGGPLHPEVRTHEGIEVAPRHRLVTVYEPVSDEPVEEVTLEVLQDLLSLVMAGDEGKWLPPIEVLEKLTLPQRQEVEAWAATCHLEASDNDVTAGPCPEALRALLPETHPYKTWRV